MAWWTPYEADARRHGRMDKNATPTEPDWTLVREVDDGTGSHIEPPLDTYWPPLWQLRWLAAAIRARTGLEISISDYAGQTYGIAVWPVGHSARPFRDAWTLLNGIESGAKAHAALVEGRR